MCEKIANSPFTIKPLTREQITNGSNEYIQINGLIKQGLGEQFVEGDENPINALLNPANGRSAIVYCAYDGATMVGMAACKLFNNFGGNDYPIPKGVIELAETTVSEAYRGKGIARSLITSIFNNAIQDIQNDLNQRRETGGAVIYPKEVKAGLTLENITSQLDNAVFMMGSTNDNLLRVIAEEAISAGFLLESPAVKAALTGVEYIGYVGISDDKHGLDFISKTPKTKILTINDEKREVDVREVERTLITLCGSEAQIDKLLDEFNIKLMTPLEAGELEKLKATIKRQAGFEPKDEVVTSETWIAVQRGNVKGAV